MIIWRKKYEAVVVEGEKTSEGCGVDGRVRRGSKPLTRVMRPRMLEVRRLAVYRGAHLLLDFELVGT